MAADGLKQDVSESAEGMREKLTGMVIMVKPHDGWGMILGSDGKQYTFRLSLGESIDGDGGAAVIRSLKEKDRVTFNKINPLPGKKLDDAGLAAENIAIDPTREADALIPKTRDTVAGLLENVEVGKPMVGTVKMINLNSLEKSFAFISPIVAEGKKAPDVFLQVDSFVGGFDEFKDLRRGDKLSFVVENTTKGPMARNVVKIEA